MKLQEAQNIYREWKDFLEIADKLMLIFPGSLPPSFLPYPPEIIEEALDIIIKSRMKDDNEREVELIRETASYFLTPFCFSALKSESLKVTDYEALNSMRKSLELILDNEEFKNDILKVLKEKQVSWIKSKQNKLP